MNRNLVDAANIAALASLKTFRRPECSLGGEDGQQVLVHPPEVSFLSLTLCPFVPVFYLASAAVIDNMICIAGARATPFDYTSSSSCGHLWIFQ